MKEPELASVLAAKAHGMAEVPTDRDPWLLMMATGFTPDQRAHRKLVCKAKSVICSGTARFGLSKRLPYGVYDFPEQYRRRMYTAPGRSFQAENSLFTIIRISTPHGITPLRVIAHAFAQDVNFKKPPGFTMHSSIWRRGPYADRHAPFERGKDP